MKIIPKALYGTLFITQSDNTRVTKPVLVERMEYKPKSNEFFFTDRRTGKKVLMRKRDETVSADNRSTYLRLQALRRAEQAYKLYKEDKKLEEGMKNLQGFLTFVSPSTYIGPAFNNNSKSYVDNVMSGEGTGDVTGKIYEYSPAHLTILNKYAGFPKLWQKKYKTPVRTVTDLENNTWYEVDIPKGYLNKEWKFKQGGKL